MSLKVSSGLMAGITYDVHLKQKIPIAKSTITFFGVSVVPLLRIPRLLLSFG